MITELRPNHDSVQFIKFLNKINREVPRRTRRARRARQPVDPTKPRPCTSGGCDTSGSTSTSRRPTGTDLSVQRALSREFDVRVLRFRPDVHVLYGLPVRHVRPTRLNPSSVGESCEHFGIISSYPSPNSVMIASESRPNGSGQPVRFAPRRGEMACAVDTVALFCANDAATRERATSTSHRPPVSNS